MELINRISNWVKLKIPKLINLILVGNCPIISIKN